ncbi:coatomer subunit epsilon-1 [Planoprotostelium fungivorum]|uniref:Coatomer subunit epsilon n=1 Tax=Planoprotostelium fungivorum TaxID=1890364 RepID=A0A2P6NG74_9EUKA|nr:coatomer subunit epsilon-1 [Planoprotostelium fungivorum]
MSNAASDLFELINFFVLGNYQAAINEGVSFGTGQLREGDLVLRDFYVYRSYIAQGNYQLVLSEIKDNAPAALQIVKLLATYSYREEAKDGIVNALKEWMKDGVRANDPLQQLIAATIFFAHGNLQDALRCVHQSSNIECLALLAQIYLRINRLDLASKEMRRMEQTDDDHTLTQLTRAWVGIAEGGEKVEEAVQTLTTLSERYGSSATLLNGLGVAALQQQQFGEAEQCFLRALEKKPSDTDAISNLITTYSHQNKSSEVIQRQLNQLASISPQHPTLTSRAALEDQFDRLQKQFA